MDNKMENKFELEAQYWWAVACLVLAGKFGVEEFQASLYRRCDGQFATGEEVCELLGKAFAVLGPLLNSTLARADAETASSSRRLA